MITRHAAQSGTTSARKSVTLARSLGLPRTASGLPASTRTPDATPGHASALRTHRVSKGIGLVLTAALAFTGAGVAASALQLSGNIASIDTDTALAAVAAERPEIATPDPKDPNAGTPLNILIMGTDDRSGDNEALGGFVEGVRSDTTMIMHISSDRKEVAMVSIPRDSTVNIPSCPTTSGRMSQPAPNTRFNAAFALGYDLGGDVESGALCAMTTIERLTNIRLDGFIVLDFVGFEAMINALGGVDICIPEAIFSPKADYLTLPAGMNHLDGTTALQFARARTGQGLGDGSDLMRIERQQKLMRALAEDVLGKNLLTDSPALLAFLGATTSSMTMSSNLASVTGLAGLAYSLRNINFENITFTTVPFVQDPNDPNAVVWTAEATNLWNDLRLDRWTNPTPPASEGVLVAEGGADNSDDAAAGSAGSGTTTQVTSPEPTPICGG